MLSDVSFFFSTSQTLANDFGVGLGLGRYTFVYCLGRVGWVILCCFCHSSTNLCYAVQGVACCVLKKVYRI